VRQHNPQVAADEEAAEAVEQRRRVSNDLISLDGMRLKQ